MKKEEKKKIGGIGDKSVLKVAEAKQNAKVPSLDNNVIKPLPVAQPAGSNYE
jgi:Cu2+-containing amine oxidase